MKRSYYLLALVFFCAMNCVEVEAKGTVVAIDSDNEVIEVEWHDLKKAKLLNALQKIKRRIKK